MDAACIIRVDEVDDPRLAVFANLRHASARACGEHFIAEGRLVVDRLIASDYPVQSVLVQRGGEQEYASQLPGDVPVYSLSRDRIRELVGFDFHRGVIACGRRLPALSWDQLDWDECECPISLALLGIREQENLGNIFRTAAALGICRVFLGPGTVDPFSRRVLRVSMGTVLKQQLFELANPSKQLSELRARWNLRTVASTLEPDAVRIDQFEVDDRPIVLMLGNEAKGIDIELQQLGSDRVTIPMQLGVDSLNVSVATAILLYELTRRAQRK